MRPKSIRKRPLDGRVKVRRIGGENKGSIDVMGDAVSRRKGVSQTILRKERTLGEMEKRDRRRERDRREVRSNN